MKLTAEELDRIAHRREMGRKGQAKYRASIAQFLKRAGYDSREHLLTDLRDGRITRKLAEIIKKCERY